MPVGINHPHFDQPEVQGELLRAAKVKVANSDVYSQGYAEFVQTFTRVHGLPPLSVTCLSKAARLRSKIV